MLYSYACGHNHQLNRRKYTEKPALSLYYSIAVELNGGTSVKREDISARIF